MNGTTSTKLNGDANGYANGDANGNHYHQNGTNGTNGYGYTAAVSPSPKPWDSLVRCLPDRDPDSDFWWQLTGRHLALLLDAAEYPQKSQFEALLLHYHWTVPCMGAAPRSYSTGFGGLPQKPKWKSVLQLDGTPLEYSWKWNSPTGQPEVRYAMEPIGPAAGTAVDPLNQLATRRVLHDLASRLPGTDLRWTHHFLSTLFDHDDAKYFAEASAGTKISTSLLISLDLLRGGVDDPSSSKPPAALKTYFQPRRLGQKTGLLPTPQWESAIAALDPHNKAREMLHDFLANDDAEGKLLSPFCLSVDDVDPSSSSKNGARLKWYFNSPHTSLASVRAVMTLGGRVPATPLFERQFAELRALVHATANLPADFPDSEEIPLAPERPNSPSTLSSSSSSSPTATTAAARDGFAEMAELLVGSVYFFDVAPGRSVPAVKFYFCVRNHGVSDGGIARGLTSWMKERGRGGYCEGFLEAIGKIGGEHRNLEDGRGTQSFVSCQFKSDGGLDITSYMAPEAFHPGRAVGGRRGTRRRGDD